MKKGTEKKRKKLFYKTNPSVGISLIVLVITIIVVIILAAAVIISLQNNNPMTEANKARINSDVANMQAIFTNTVGKIMAENQDVVQVVGGQLYTTPTDSKKTKGEATYQILGTDGTPVVEGKIIFGTGEKSGTTYYTGKELPLYGSDTKWSVDNQGLLSVEVGGVMYGEGEQVVINPNEIAQSANPMLQSWKNNSSTDFHASEYKSKITKIKFMTADKVSDSKIESWDVSEAKDKSVMAWIESDGSEGYILTIAGKEKIIANSNSSSLFWLFEKVKEIENLELLDTNNVTEMNGMFGFCRSLININLSSFNTSNVTSMSNMFNECSSLTNINLSSFDISNVTSMSNMFNGCTKLTKLDLSSFITTTSKKNSIYGMFKNCTSLTELKFNEKFNILSMNSADSAFENCYNLTTTLTLKYVGGSISNLKMFLNAATVTPAKITMNYYDDYAYFIDSTVSDYKNRFPDSNIVKGIQVD